MIPAHWFHSNQAGVRLGFLNQILQRDFVIPGKDEIRSIGVLAAQHAEGVYSNPGTLSRTEQDTPNLHASVTQQSDPFDGLQTDRFEYATRVLNRDRVPHRRPGSNILGDHPACVARRVPVVEGVQAGHARFPADMFRADIRNGCKFYAELAWRNNPKAR